MSLMLIRSIGTMFSPQYSLRRQPLNQTCVWILWRLSKIRNSFFSKILQRPPGLTKPLLCCLRETFANQFNPSVHLPFCPSPNHLHVLTPTHSFFFSISYEIRRSLLRGSLRPLIRNISLLCLILIRVVGGWQRGNFL